MEKIPHGLFRLVGHPVQEQIETRLNVLFEDLFDANSEVWASLLDLRKELNCILHGESYGLPCE
ncbi:MAG TPA: hypothetical protein VFA65_20475 [Bryobacteraceae bacterium]|nr:hypothetical protein [Bryobacteraceae bacterium]